MSVVELRSESRSSSYKTQETREKTDRAAIYTSTYLGQDKQEIAWGRRGRHVKDESERGSTYTGCKTSPSNYVHRGQETLPKITREVSSKQVSQMGKSPSIRIHKAQQETSAHVRMYLRRRRVTTYVHAGYGNHSIYVRTKNRQVASQHPSPLGSGIGEKSFMAKFTYTVVLCRRVVNGTLYR